MALLLAAVAGGTLASAGAAQAGDLIVLAPDSAVISGTVIVDHVYIADGATLRLAGDTTLIASDVYLANGANLRTCFVPPSSDTGCTTGRNLAIQSSGEVNIGSGISLTAGGGTPRPGGGLSISGTAIAITGGIDTSGSMGGASGPVTLASSGSVSISGPYYQASVNAPGAPVSIHGAGVSLTGDLDTGGTDPAYVNAGPVSVGSSAALNIRGNVNAYGRDNPAGVGGGVILQGTDVRVGRVDVSAGTSSTAGPGAAGAVSITGTASVTVSDYIDARGASGATGNNASAGGNVTITSAGPVITGTIYSSGADANTAAPSGPGTISVTGGSVATGQLWAVGGSRTANAGPGAGGGLVQVTAAGPLSVDEVEANGGNSLGDGVAGGHGGEIDLSGDGIFTSELRTTPGNSSGISPGGSGGPVHVTGKSLVTILGGVYTGGGNASGGASNPPMAGGAGGVVTLHASVGALSLASPIRTSGGNGGNAPNGVKAGPGGPGGSVDLVGSPIDPIAGIATDGGDAGSSNSTDTRGTGGNGGFVHAWSETNVFGGLRSVSTSGGSGAPPGLDGAELQDSAPSGLAVDPATGLLSFTSQSPNAQGYQVLRSIAGAAATSILTTGTTSKIAVPAPALCTPVTYQVVAFRSDVGWTSPPTAAVAYTRQPSATQKCTDAPSLIHSKTVVLKLKNLTKKKGSVSFVVQTNGLGTVTATATSKGVKKPLAVATLPAARAGALTVTLKLDLKSKLTYKTVKGHQVARVSVKLVAVAPSGSSKTSITVPVEVRK
jgi:hypothetical protein